MNKLTEKDRGRPRYITDLPVYDSMQTAEAATGIPKEAFQLAIKSGAQIKHHGRIDLGEFIRWWFQSKRPEGEEDEAAINWKRRGERATTLLTEIDLMKKQATVLDKAEGFRFLARLMGLFFDELERYKNEFPMTLVGKDSVGISVDVKLQIAKTKDALKSALDKFEKADDE